MQARGMSNCFKVVATVATNSIIGWSGVVVHIILRDVLLQNTMDQLDLCEMSVPGDKEVQ